MTPENPSRPPWLAPVFAAIERHDNNGAFLVLFEIYRPDLVRAMAHALSMRFIDFREQYMQPLGRDASRIPLAKIGEVVAESYHDEAESNRSEIKQPSGIVLHNVEALLATRDGAARANWMEEFIGWTGRTPVIVPLAVFANEAPTVSPRVVRIDPSSVPQEKLLFRLAGQ